MRTLIAALVLATSSTGALAQGAADYPSKPIRFISISAAGSDGDVLVRLLADKMAPLLKTSFVVENRPGAGGSIAVNTAAKAPADGYTITIGGATTHVLLPASNPKLPYNAVKDFAYIGQVGTAAIALMAAADFPANSLPELVALAKRQPGTQYASWGNGSTGHFCGGLLNQKTQAGLEHVPYKSVAQIQTDLYGGHVKLGFVDMATAVPMVRSGRAKAIGLCTTRSASLPNVRSYEDEGITDTAQRAGAFRWGVYAPAGTPKPIVDKLSGALKAALDLPEVRAQLLDMGIQPAFLAGDAVQEMTAREIETWKAVAQAASITMD